MYEENAPRVFRRGQRVYVVGVPPKDTTPPLIVVSAGNVEATCTWAGPGGYGFITYPLSMLMLEPYGQLGDTRLGETWANGI